jgi:ABC-2 type transport system ATP-binding protein
MIINEGRIAAQGRPEEIAANMKGGETWELCLKGPSAENLGAKLETLGAGLSPASLRADETGALSFSLHTDGLEGEAIFDWAVSQGFKILRMNQKRLSLEDIFVKLTNEAASKEAVK